MRPSEQEHIRWLQEKAAAQEREAAQERAAVDKLFSSPMPSEPPPPWLAAALEQAKDGTVVKEAGVYKLFLSSKTESGYKGVVKLPSGRFRWEYYDKALDKNVCIGTYSYDTSLEAAVAYAKHMAAKGIYADANGMAVPVPVVRLSLIPHLTLPTKRIV